MGKDVTVLRIDNKIIVNSNGVALDIVHETAKKFNEKVQVAKDLKTNEESLKKQDVLTVKNINTEVGTPEGKIKAMAFKPTKKMLNSHVKSFPENIASQGVQTSSNRHKKRPDEEDAFSLASLAASSVLCIKSKVTVPEAPTLRAAERAEIRREFQKRLEEKQKVLEAEKLEYASRSKEVEDKVIKQLRKSMTYKANPVPSFYHKGSPPKVELKKLPVTRPKSPNLTRRKSCSDVVKPSTDESKCSARTTRHSIGVCKDVSASPGTPKAKDLPATRNVNGPSKLKDSNISKKVKVARPKDVKDISVTPCTLEQKS